MEGAVVILWRVLETLIGGIGCILVYLYRQSRGEIAEVKADVVNLRATHETDMQSFLSECAAKHEREYTRATDYATKSDVAEIKTDIRAVRADVQSINNNLLVIAQRGQ